MGNIQKSNEFLIWMFIFRLECKWDVKVERVHSWVGVLSSFTKAENFFHSNRYIDDGQKNLIANNISLQNYLFKWVGIIS